MQMRPVLLLPEILVFLGGLVVLLGGSFLPRDRQWIARIVAAVALLGAAATAAIAKIILGGSTVPKDLRRSQGSGSPSRSGA